MELRKIKSRFFQLLGNLDSKLLHFKKPKRIISKNALLKIPSILKENNASNVIIISDAYLLSLSQSKKMIEELKNNMINVTLFDGVQEKATEKRVDQALELYKKNRCDSIISLGGASMIDVSKILGALASDPNLTYISMQSEGKIKKRLPLFIAATTITATGQESSYSAYLYGPITKDVYSVTSPLLLPHYVVGDTFYPLSASKDILAYSCMDVLSYSLEAYVSLSKNKKGRVLAEESISLILENFEKFYQDQNDENLASSLLLASYKRGLSSSYLGEGYISSISHILGAMCNKPHGYIASLICPYVLELYGSSINRKLSILAKKYHFTPDSAPESVQAHVIIEKIKDMNQSMGIPQYLEGAIKRKDIPLIVDQILDNSSSLFLTPRVFSKKELIKLLKRVCVDKVV